MTNKLFLFDADETLWNSEGKDYISSKSSALQMVDSLTLTRTVDQKYFRLMREVPGIFRVIKNKGYTIGIVSDNKKFMVVSALKLFGLWTFVDPKAVNIKLWKGYCPKHLMVQQILEKTQTLPKNCYWIDDKDYSSEARTIKVKFFNLKEGRSLALFIDQHL